MNPPARTFTLVATTVAALLLMHQLPTLSIGGTQLREVNILSQVVPENDGKQVDVLPTTPPHPIMVQTKKGAALHFKEVWTKGVEPIFDYSSGAAGGMDHFYSQLTKVKQLDRPVRIAYFGDSYIEGDILTADLRELFQRTWGGCGVGWVDTGSRMQQNRISIRQQYSGITEYAVAKKPFDISKQGINERYFAPREGSWIKVSGTKNYAHTQNWTISTLYFHTPTSVTIKSNDGKGHISEHKFTGSTAVQKLEVKDSLNSIGFAFKGVGSGTFLYGLTLDGDKGVTLDNFSMRGSPGLTLAKIPTHRLQDFSRLRPYDLIVLHFGLNVAVPGNPLSVMKGYTTKMKKVIELMRQTFPQASILVVSVPDRDQRSPNGIQTMKEVKQLVALQQQMAADMKVAFLNFFEAMGGEGSVKTLVERSYANKDYTHLNYKGGKELARKMFPSFKEGYKNYVRRKAIETK